LEAISLSERVRETWITRLSEVNIFQVLREETGVNIDKLIIKYNWLKEINFSTFDI
jgi:hypothetical protein